MKVVHVINSMIVGGAEKLLHDVIIEFNRKGIEQHLVTLYGKGELFDKISGMVTHIDLSVTRWNFYFKAQLLKRYLKKIKPDIVHAHLFESMIVSRLACKRNFKLAFTYHGSLYTKASADFSKKWLAADKFTYNDRYKTIFVSNAIKDEICCSVQIKNNFKVIPNFADNCFKNIYSQKNSDELKIVSIGNLRAPKNHEFSVKALAELNNAKICFDIYGNGNKEQEINSIAKETNTKINIKKQQAITPELLNEYNLYLMPSTQEGMSVALIEALKTGMPCVLSDIPSFKETAGDAAKYFSLSSTAELKKIIGSILADKKTLDEMSKQSVRVAERYSIDNHVNQLLSFYQS
jgi:glycosyltransferase involved in cell wall biosynthesis